MSKAYSVRVPAGTPEVISEDVGGWLDAQLASQGTLAADPGAGERTLRLSLEQRNRVAARCKRLPQAVTQTWNGDSRCLAARLAARCRGRLHGRAIVVRLRRRLTDCLVQPPDYSLDGCPASKSTNARDTSLVVKS